MGKKTNTPLPKGAHEREPPGRAVPLSEMSGERHCVQYIRREENSYGRNIEAQTSLLSCTRQDMQRLPFQGYGH